MASNVAIIEVDDVGVRGPPGSSGSGLTIDTGEPYRVVMLSNGSVFAIPADAIPPATPTGLSRTVKLTSVKLTWAAVPGAASYIIQRGGVQIGTATAPTFLDTNLLAGSTYSYTVSSVDQYGQRSPQSDPVTAFVDPALNAAPTDVAIRCWPLPIPTDGPAFIRVNGREIDAQAIAFTLGVDAGSITPTPDPTVWALRI